MECAAFHRGEQGVLTRLAEIPIAKWYDSGAWRSIGKVYSRVTMVLGLGVQGEGKTMGLASYGTPRFDFSTILNVKSFRDWTIDRRNVSKLYGAYTRKNSKEPLTQDHKDLAASLQAALEEAFINLGKDAHGRTGIKNFALAGGCALNCNANSRLLQEDFCDQIFIQPASHDGGVALGAALETMHRVGDGDFISFPHAYWGPGYTNEEIEKILKGAKVAYKKSANIVEETADLIVAGKIVGWFQGRMELGPRALGTRSILADPAIKGINDRVNEDIKHREVWRPFAPSVALEAAPTYFEGMEKAKESPYMLQTFYVREKYRDVLPAITHVDGSSRIQTVTREQNPRYYDLLKALEKRTGRAIVLDTSFNDAGEPIVCSPQDALRCYFATGFDALAIGDFLLMK
jgi:carbamoyltransferase